MDICAGKSSPAILLNGYGSHVSISVRSLCAIETSAASTITIAAMVAFSFVTGNDSRRKRSGRCARGGISQRFRSDG